MSLSCNHTQNICQGEDNVKGSSPRILCCSDAKWSYTTFPGGSSRFAWGLRCSMRPFCSSGTRRSFGPLQTTSSCDMAQTDISQRSQNVEQLEIAKKIGKRKPCFLCLALDFYNTIFPATCNNTNSAISITNMPHAHILIDIFCYHVSKPQKSPRKTSQQSKNLISSLYPGS